MFFTRQRQVQTAWNYESGIGKINVLSGSDIEKQIQMIELTEEDLDIIHGLKPYINEKLECYYGYLLQKSRKGEFIIQDY